MKTLLVRIAQSMAAAAALSAAVTAAPIVGEINLSGTGAITLINDTGAAGAATPNNADAIDFPVGPNAFVTAVSGSFAGLSGQAVTQNDFRFNGASGSGYNLPPITPLWTVGATGWSFDLASITMVDQGTAGFLNITGVGTFKGPAGFDNTTGRWSFTATTTQSLFTWTSGNSVPDSGSSLVLMGLGLALMGFVARRMNLIRR